MSIIFCELMQGKFQTMEYCQKLTKIGFTALFLSELHHFKQQQHGLLRALMNNLQLDIYYEC